VVELSSVQARHVEKPYIATLATVRPDGSPHTAPVWYRYVEGAFFVLTERSSRKARNVIADPRVELCIDDRLKPPYHTVIVRGRASIEPYPGDEWRRALGSALAKMGNLKEAENKYREVLALNSDDAEAWRELRSLGKRY